MSNKTKLPNCSHWIQFQKRENIYPARCSVGGASSALERHVKDKQVKDAAKDVEQDVSGAAENSKSN